MARHVYKGVVENFGAAHFHMRFYGVEVGVQVLVAKYSQVLERGGVGIPVAAAVIYEQGQLHALGMRSETKDNKK